VNGLLKWIEGSIVSYLKGKTPVNILIGRIRRAIESYGVTPGDIQLLISSIASNPAYLPSVSIEEKRSKLKPIEEELEKLVNTMKSNTSRA